MMLNEFYAFSPLQSTKHKTKALGDQTVLQGFFIIRE